jgi:hypothetical protein
VNYTLFKTGEMKQILLVCSMFSMAFLACSKSTPRAVYTPDCSGPAKSFAADVSALVASSCAGSGCHDAGSTRGPGALTSYNQIFSARSAIRRAVADGSMPQNGSLSNAQKDAILCWIDSGAPNN